MLIFFLSCLIGGLLAYLINNSCDAIVNYTWSVQFGLGEMIHSVLKMTFIFVIGIVVFGLIRKKIPQRNYNSIKLIYFAVLPLFVFHHQFLSIPRNILNRSIKSSICEKSVDNGIRTETMNITLTEYEFLKNRLFLLPDLPNTADSINIMYYHDDFFGDFDLNVHFRCSKNEPIDTSDKRWNVITSDKLIDKKRVRYHDGVN
ncbi:MAG TPA: hypothetical protein VNX68_08570 [Nitrosopumilaceae archaeon]|jgi:hypothetical protein|nr:hypothetical protein [Nitrosopumilaceae archaeon]